MKEYTKFEATSTLAEEMVSNMDIEQLQELAELSLFSDIEKMTPHEFYRA